jgi:hypothetical protein
MKLTKTARAMRSLAIAILVSSSYLAAGQVKVDGIDINSLPDVKYIEIVGVERLLSTKITVVIDYGQKMKFGSGQRIEKDDGRPIIFNSMVEALNFLCRNGWEFVNNYAVMISNENVYHFLLRRRETEGVAGD